MVTFLKTRVIRNLYMNQNVKITVTVEKAEFGLIVSGARRVRYVTGNVNLYTEKIKNKLLMTNHEAANRKVKCVNNEACHIS